MVSFLTVMSHLILQTSLYPLQVHSQFLSLQNHCPAYVRSWLSSDQQEVLLELDLPRLGQHEYLALRLQTGSQMILHVLKEGEERDYQALEPVLQGLLSWLKDNDAQLQVLRHTFGQYAALSPSPLS